MNKLLHNRYAIFLLAFVMVTLIDYKIIPVANLAYDNLLSLSSSPITRVIIELLLGLVGVILVRLSGKYVYSLMGIAPAELVVTWPKFMSLLLCCVPLFWGFYLILWSVAYLINDLV